MKKAKSVLALVLATIMIFSGCSSQASSKQNSSNAAGGSSSKATGEPYTVKWAYLVMTGASKELQQVDDAINKITIPQANVKIDLMPITAAQWTQQMNLMLASNEKLDVTLVAGNLSSMVAKNQLIPLDSLIDQYGQGIKKVISDESPDYYNALKINNKVYGVTTMREFVANEGICMRKDIATKLGIDPSKKITMDQAEAILKQIQQAYPSLTPLDSQTSTSSIGSYLLPADSLGDGNGVLMNFGQDDDFVVKDLFETPEYANLIGTLHKWYQEGLILKDITTNTEQATALVKAGKIAGFVTNMKPGFDVQEEQSTGCPMVDLTMLDPVASTSGVQAFTYGIPNNCKNPEAAMKMMNLVYTNKDVANLMIWGIEGIDYVKTSTPNVITYPSGVTGANVAWSQGLGWELGNQFNAYVWQGNAADLNDQTIAFNKNALKSKALGFSWDPTSVKDNISALTNVKNQYEVSLEDGVSNPETVLPKFISALKAAGMGAVVKEKQKQLDTWRSATSGK